MLGALEGAPSASPTRCHHHIIICRVTCVFRAPLQAPFIVTSCKHAFCEKHTREPNFDDSTCPGCRSHVSRVGGGGGMRATNYVLSESDQDVLNGTTPDVAVGVALNAVQFW